MSTCCLWHFPYLCNLSIYISTCGAIEKLNVDLLSHWIFTLAIWYITFYWFIIFLTSSEYQGPGNVQRNFIRKGKAKRECAPASFLLKIATYNYNNTLLCDYRTYTVSLGLLHQQNGTSLYFVFICFLWIWHRIKVTKKCSPWMRKVDAREL
jgi:hypothetical protein